MWFLIGCIGYFFASQVSKVSILGALTIAFIAGGLEVYFLEQKDN